MLTAERLREILRYDPETGVFIWQIDRGRVKSGYVAGCIGRLGYRKIAIDRESYLAHRLAFLYMTGEWPPCEVDHKNLMRADNRWDNLRLASQSQNQGNTKLAATNTSGFKGVTWNKKTSKWRAHIGMRGEVRYLGGFDRPEEAHAAYLAAAEKHFGEFARSGS